MKIELNRRWIAITSALVLTVGIVMPPVFAQATTTFVHQSNLSNPGHTTWGSGAGYTHAGSFNNHNSPAHMGKQPWIIGYKEVPAGPYIYNPATGVSGPSGYVKEPIFSPNAPSWFILQHMVAIPMSVVANPLPEPVTHIPVTPVAIANPSSPVKPIVLQDPPANVAPVPATVLQLPSVNFTPLPISTYSAIDVYQASLNHNN